MACAQAADVPSASEYRVCPPPPPYECSVSSSGCDDAAAAPAPRNMKVLPGLACRRSPACLQRPPCAPQVTPLDKTAVQWLIEPLITPIPINAFFWGGKESEIIY